MSCYTHTLGYKPADDLQLCDVCVRRAQSRKDAVTRRHLCQAAAYAYRPSECQMALPAWTCQSKWGRRPNPSLWSH
jgi:hypothetical protein